MVQVSRRTGFTGSALIRLLSRLGDIDVPESKQAFADRLSQWLGWTDAISLSAALNGGPMPVPTGVRASSGSAEEREFTRVRTLLAEAIADDTRNAPVDPSANFAAYRRRYLARQQAMQTRIGPLRARLRSTLAARSPDMARLAAVDVVMEQAVSAQEQRLLATVPAMLEKHFERLRKTDNEVEPGAWLTVFQRDMQDVLIAEMEIRFQPVEGLLQALRTS
ncbi:DUF3348 domain-containing protein [Variovorax boronicumulans]|uniref:DUF3348 domain-containing protein n=1 Tax=Variovorax boronicumulans TaxID=436515 RepID=UPI00339850F2